MEQRSVAVPDCVVVILGSPERHHSITAAESLGIAEKMKLMIMKVKIATRPGES